MNKQDDEMSHHLMHIAKKHQIDLSDLDLFDKEGLWKASQRLRSAPYVKGVKELPRELREKVFSHLNNPGKKAVASASKNLRNHMKPVVDSIKASTRSTQLAEIWGSMLRTLMDMMRPDERMLIGLIAKSTPNPHRHFFAYIFDASKKRYLRYEIEVDNDHKPVDRKDFKNDQDFIDDVKKSYVFSKWRNDALTYGGLPIYHAVTIHSLTDKATQQRAKEFHTVVTAFDMLLYERMKHVLNMVPEDLQITPKTGINPRTRNMYEEHYSAYTCSGQISNAFLFMYQNHSSMYYENRNMKAHAPFMRYVHVLGLLTNQTQKSDRKELIINLIKHLASGKLNKWYNDLKYWYYQHYHYHNYNVNYNSNFNLNVEQI